MTTESEPQRDALEVATNALHQEGSRDALHVARCATLSRVVSQDEEPRDAMYVARHTSESSMIDRESCATLCKSRLDAVLLQPAQQEPRDALRVAT